MGRAGRTHRTLEKGQHDPGATTFLCTAPAGDPGRAGLDPTPCGRGASSGRNMRRPRKKSAVDRTRRHERTNHLRRPGDLREACQWIIWFHLASRTYNRDGAGGQIDSLLRPFYEQDKANGILDDETAVYYLACLLINDPIYWQLGGPDASAATRPRTSRSSSSKRRTRSIPRSTSPYASTTGSIRSCSENRWNTW